MPFKKGDVRPAGSGRKKGQVNRHTAALKDCILAAFEEAGGKDYLLKVARTKPEVFCGLLSKILPLTLAGEVNQTIRYEVDLVFGSSTLAPQLDEDGAEHVRH
jgi:hypothetical protein